MRTTLSSDARGHQSFFENIEKFSKYKIDQLAIFREANILISLSNAIVSLYDLGTYELQEQLTRTKGALTFAVTSNIVKDEEDDVPSLVSRLAVAVKRRLLLWSWQDGELREDVVEIALASTIKSLTWATGTTIVAGLNANYELVDRRVAGDQDNRWPRQYWRNSGSGHIQIGRHHELHRHGINDTRTFSYWLR